MKLTYNWLKKYIDVPYTPEELVEKLTMAGIEVENVTTTNTIPKGIIVAEILERNPHPNADKLSICRVSTGKEELQIVCGAPNCDAGTKAPLATIGTVFVDDTTGEKFKIKKSKLRGVESFGMLCSSVELGLDEDHSGIMEFSKDTTVGQTVTELLKPDTIYDLEITSNRPDWLSVIGIAREIKALSEKEIKDPSTAVPKVQQDKNYSKLIEVKDTELCPKYTGRVIRGITVGESPAWMKELLISIGLRPINNIVDISNFVLFETGQPLHIFDLDELDEKRIIVRRAKKNEKITALDSIEYKLSNDDLVIADAKKPVCIAGIMGGEHSGVTEKTKNILIESAYFNSASVRATSKRLNLSSDSSHRFERGIDTEMICLASNRAATLIHELAGGTLCSELIEIENSKKSPKPKTVVCHFDNIRKLLGINICNGEIIDIFKRLALNVHDITEEKCNVTATSFRLDIEREADLAEEIVRIHGLSKVPIVKVKAITGGSIREDAYFRLATACDELISLGLTECINYTLIDKKNILKNLPLKEKDLLEVINPISNDSSTLRPSLLFGILKNLERNIARNIQDLKLFEIGTVYSANKSKYPEERKSCCIAITGRKHPERYSKEKTVQYDFYDMKGLIESWLEMRKITNYSIRKTDNLALKPGLGADIVVNEKTLISFGEIAPNFTEEIRLRHPIYVALIELSEILNVSLPTASYKPIPQFPAVTRDVALIVDKTFESGLIVDCMKHAKCKILEKIEVLDLYEDVSIGKNKKSIAYTLTFRDPSKTLTDKDVNKAHEMIKAGLIKKLPVTLR